MNYDVILYNNLIFKVSIYEFNLIISSCVDNQYYNIQLLMSI